MAAVTICSDFGAQENKVWHCFPIYLPISDFMWQLPFSVLLSSVIISRSTHVAASGIISLFLMAEYYSTACMHYIFFLLFLSWHRVALDCCVSFCCPVKWVSHTHPLSFLDVLPIYATTAVPGARPVLHSRSRSFSVLHVAVYIRKSQPPPLQSTSLLSLPYPYVCSLHQCLYLSFAQKITCAIFSGLYIYVLTVFVFLRLQSKW